MLLRQLDVIENMRRYQMMRHPFAHIPLGEDDFVGADFGQHLTLELACCLDDNVGNIHFLQNQSGHDTGLDILPDGHHHHIKIAEPQVAQSILIGRIRLNGVGYPVANLLDSGFIFVHRQYLIPQLVQIFRHTGAETPHSDHRKLLFHPPGSLRRGMLYLFIVA
ncbi:hypothetical protein D3C75_833070 [compost metagenome]